MSMPLPLNEAAGYVAGIGLLAATVATPSFDATMAEGMREDMRSKGEVWVRVGREAVAAAAREPTKKLGTVYRRFRNIDVGEDVATMRGGEATSSASSEDDESLRIARAAGAVATAASSLGAVYKRTIRALSSFPLALAELGVLAALSALGTWLEQGLTPDAYAEKLSNSRALAAAVTFLGFDHMFSSPVFLATALLLAMSLASCSATRQLPLVKVSKRWKMVSNIKLLARMDVSCALHGRVHASSSAAASSAAASTETRSGEGADALLALASCLASQSYNVFVEESTLYAFKGLAGRVAPIAVHVSMLAIMAGSTIGALAGASGDALVPVGGVVSTASVLSQNAGPLHDARSDAKLPSLLVNDFRIEYTDSGDIDQFYSDLSVVEVDATGENAETLSSKTISVNDPLRFSGTAVYQDTWALNSIEVVIDGDSVVLPMVKLDATAFGVGGDIWGAFLPVDGAVPSPGRGAVILARDFQSAFIYNTDGSFVGARRPGSKKELVVPDVVVVSGAQQAEEEEQQQQQQQQQGSPRDHTIKVARIGGSTGLRFKQDPGVPLVYVGFAALLISTLLSYESHSQVWACLADESGGGDGSGDVLISVGGKTNRAKVSFREEVEKIMRDARARIASLKPVASTMSTR